MNAISPTACLHQATERTANDLGMLQRLVELAMQLAELAARQAHAEAAALPPDQPAKHPPQSRRADPHLVFLRLRRAIHETIAFRNRLAAGILPKVSREPAARPLREPAPRPTPEPAILAPTPPADPRRTKIIRYFHEAIDITEKKRKTPITYQDIENRITAELAKDPQHRLQGRVVLLNICKSLDLPFYANRIHPDLFRPPRNEIAEP